MSVVLSSNGIFPPNGFALNQYANIHKFDLIINDPQQCYTVSLFCDIINKKITDHFITRGYLGIKSDEVVLNDKLTNDEIDIISAYGIRAVEAVAKSYTGVWLEMLDKVCL
jgi:hypothetical protein